MTHEEMAKTLEATGDYRVLRRLSPRTSLKADGPTRLGLFVDVETTGLDPARDEIIELAMVPFTYSLSGEVLEVHQAFQSYREPSVPIAPEITALTGITDAMVEGASIDPDVVASFVAPAAVVVAHNAGFDRRFLERLSPVFTTKPWACSMSQVEWQVEGFEGTKLAYLVAHAGFFYDRHRAMNDCLAAIELLARPLPSGGATALGKLLDRARRPTYRIWAENSPFEFKDLLKARGYRWNPEGNAQPRAWYVDVAADLRDAEIIYLQREIYQNDVNLLVTRIDAHDRFSDRV
jgi:DNA polymerase-3 subunit epsilon